MADRALVALPDDQILARVAATGRALVTASIKDFMPLDAQYRAAGQAHAGLILVSAKTFPQDRSHTHAVTSALAALLDQPRQIQGLNKEVRRRTGVLGIIPGRDAIIRLVGLFWANRTTNGSKPAATWAGNPRRLPGDSTKARHQR